MSPLRLLHREPVAECLQAELQQPVGFALLLRDEPNHILVESHRDYLSMHIGGEAELILLLRDAAHQLVVALRAVVKGLYVVVMIVFHLSDFRR